MLHEFQNAVPLVADLGREANEVFERVVWPANARTTYTQTLFGYVQRFFGFVDLLSAYWKGTGAGNQSARMVEFMERYFGPNRRAHSINIQMWRHKLAHTAMPRNLLDETTGRTVHYMIQWSERTMTEHQPHYTIVSFGSGEVFNLACLTLIGELERATQAFQVELHGSATLQTNAAKFANELTGYTLGTMKP